jgi:uncharacterized protein
MNFQILRNRILFQLFKLKRIRRRKELQKTFVGTSSHVPLPYSYSAGRFVSLFLQGLKEGKLLASRCRHCETTLVPCRQVCGNCFKEMEDLAELSGIGTIHTFTQVSFPFIDPFTGKNRPVPYCYAMIHLDGSDNAFQGVLNVRDHHQLKSGMAVRVVFHRNRRGEMEDIRHFEVL